MFLSACFSLRIYRHVLSLRFCVFSSVCQYRAMSISILMQSVPASSEGRSISEQEQILCIKNRQATLEPVDKGPLRNEETVCIKAHSSINIASQCKQGFWESTPPTCGGQARWSISPTNFVKKTSSFFFWKLMARTGQTVRRWRVASRALPFKNEVKTLKLSSSRGKSLIRDPKADLQ